MHWAWSKICIVIIAVGASVNKPGHLQLPPLHLALTTLKFDVVEFLLQQKAQPFTYIGLKQCDVMQYMNSLLRGKPLRPCAHCCT